MLDHQNDRKKENALNNTRQQLQNNPRKNMSYGNPHRETFRSAKM